ncbi:MAG: phosphoribosylformylglycinamidine cyclo-ligase [Kiritimatiellae bacterium]|nr:phosphoribosylformylglycinamidine cyclo-ligase [Kiritimatiellia bacterium]
MARRKMVSSYAAAGVDIDVKMKALKAARKGIEATFTRGVVGKLGSFGGLFRSPGADTLLVSSADGVGTKLKVAAMTGRHDTVGQDIVNHCVNDILVQGAHPLFFLDYIGASHLDAGVLAAVLRGVCKACRENDCALIGGETAEMPGLYPEGEYDLVGTIVGAVKRAEVITGRGIRVGDVLIGLPSSGLHTNGYSLARRILFEQAGLKPADRLPGTRTTVADALLAVHRSYLKPILALRKRVEIRGLAHITGGGFPDNLPRVLPERLTAVVDRAAWTVPHLFQFLQDAGRVDREEMYRVFNMGIGMVIVVRGADVLEALRALHAAGEHPVPIGNMQRRASARAPQVRLEH